MQINKMNKDKLKKYQERIKRIHGKRKENMEINKMNKEKLKKRHEQINIIHRKRKEKINQSD